MKTTTLKNESQNWISRYKLYQFPFWLLYNYVWWVVAVGDPVVVMKNLLFTPYSIKFSFYVIFQTIAVCINLYYLLPKYLAKGRYALYISYVLLVTLTTSVVIVSGYYFSSFLSGQPMSDLYGKNASFFSFFSTALPSTMAAMTLALSIKLTKNWIQTQRHQQLLEKEKLETELKFLKYQFNPHFLFNSINSIFFLIHKNPDMASASLAKFSDLLRHQLYECNDKQIPLNKEITYLRNFIELEKLRQNDRLEVDFQMIGYKAEPLAIAPFILMTFVENAFKHVSQHSDEANWITIQLHIDQEHLLRFTVSNSASANASKDVVDYGGIGLQNVQRRLDLLYPEKYNLKINSNGSRFDVELLLQTEELVRGNGMLLKPDLALAI